jgi:hypothetical protein
MTPEDFEAQEVMFERLKREFDQLNDQFEKNLKAIGITEADLGSLDLDKESPEVKLLMEQAQQAAQRAGQDRVAAAKNQPPTPKVPYGGARRGGLKV